MGGHRAYKGCQGKLAIRPLLTFVSAWGNIDPVGELRLQPGLDSPEQPEAHLAVIVRERDHETDLTMA